MSMRAFPIIWFGCLSLLYIGLTCWNVHLGRIGWVIADTIFVCVLTGMALYHYRRSAPHA